MGYLILSICHHNYDNKYLYTGIFSSYYGVTFIGNKMEIEYKRPVKNEKGVYVFENPFSELYNRRYGSGIRQISGRKNIILTGSEEDARRLENGLLDITDLLVGRLKDFELPLTVSGKAMVRFEECFIGKDNFLNRLGLIVTVSGLALFPKIDIETSFGETYLMLYPSYRGEDITISYDGKIFENTVIGLESKIAEFLGAESFETFENSSGTPFIESKIKYSRTLMRRFL